jgi:hypothetical protein
MLKPIIYACFDIACARAAEQARCINFDNWELQGFNCRYDIFTPRRAVRAYNEYRGLLQVLAPAYSRWLYTDRSTRVRHDDKTDGV